MQQVLKKFSESLLCTHIRWKGPSSWQICHMDFQMRLLGFDFSWPTHTFGPIRLTIKIFTSIWVFKYGLVEMALVYCRQIMLHKKT